MNHFAGLVIKENGTHNSAYLFHIIVEVFHQQWQNFIIPKVKEVILSDKIFTEKITVPDAVVPIQFISDARIMLL